MKKIICSKKSHAKLKKFHQQNNFIYKFYIWIWKFCRNWLILVWDIANLWFKILNVQNLKKCFVFKKYVPNLKKNVIYEIVLPFNFTIVFENLIQIGSLVTEIQNYGVNVCFILYEINLFVTYGQHE